MFQWRWLVCCVALACASGFAQTTTGTIQGTVRDTSGAVVPGTSVQITNTKTGVAYSAVSNEEGRYVAPLLPPGDYTVAVEQTGFQRYLQSNVKLDVQQVRLVDIDLRVGDVATTIAVEASATPLATSNSTVATVIENKKILDLPLNGRDAVRLALLTPGIMQFHQWDSTPWISGGRNGTSGVSIDGISVIAPATSGAHNDSLYTPVVDAVQEFAVMTNSLAAEYGRTGGGVINLATRSGTNDLHGSAWDFLRNSQLDANGFFRNRSRTPRSPFQRNQFGATLGGPVVIPGLYNGRNRTFFFTDYEGVRWRRAASFTGTVPLPEWREGNFSNLRFSNGQPITIYDPLTTMLDAQGNYTRTAFPNNIIPSNRLDPVGRAMATFYPLPNVTPANQFTQVNNFFGAGKTQQDSNQFDARIDHNFSQSWRMFGRYSRKEGKTIPFNPFGNAAAPVGGPSSSEMNNLALDQTIALNSTTMLNIRYGFGRAHYLGSPPGAGFDISQLGFASNVVNLARLQNLEWPTTTVQGFSALGPGGSWSLNYPEMTHAFHTDFSKVKGSHTIKTGVEFRKLLFNQYLFGNPSGTYTVNAGWTQRDAVRASTTEGFGLASLLLGVPAGGSVTHDVATAAASSYWGFYVQDDWRATSRLTLNFGLRYDIDTPRTERYNRQSWFDPTAPSPIAGRVPGFPNLTGAMRFATPDDRQQTPTDSNNVGPRFGFAYRVTPKMVARGGYGLMYSPSIMQAGGNAPITGRDGFSSNTQMVVSLDGRVPLNYLRNPFPDGFNLPLGPGEGPMSGASTNLGLNPGNGYFLDHRNPVVQQWNFNLQREFFGSLLIEAGYLGSKGNHLIDGENLTINQLPASYLSLGNALSDQVSNPFFGIITNPTSPLSRPTVQRSQLLRPFPQYTAVTTRARPQANSIYHAFILRVEKRYSNGLGVLVSFTGGKLIDDSSGAVGYLGPIGTKQDYYNRAADRSLSTQDISRRLVTSFNYDLPIGRGRAFLASAPAIVQHTLGGWQVNGIITLQTGLPVALGQTQNTTGLGTDTQRPNSMGQSAYIGSGGRTKDEQMARWFNPEVFRIAPAFTFGNVGRTLPDVRRPGTRNVDLSIFKNFRFAGERANVQFRAEAFNAFNTTQFGDPDARVGSPGIGVIGSTAADPRQVQLALKFLF